MKRKIKQLFGNSWPVLQWIASCLMQVLSASGEAYLHHNLGRRYLPTVFMAFIVCWLYSCVAPRGTFLIHIFVFGFLIRIISHLVSILLRRSRGRQEPHSYSTGEPFPFWNRFGPQQTTVRRYVEPAFCFLIAFFIPSSELPLAAWIGGSATSLFIKEHVIYFRMRRRVLDMVDSRIESQELNSSVTSYLNPRRRERESSNRPHLPGNRPYVRRGRA